MLSWVGNRKDQDLSLHVGISSAHICGSGLSQKRVPSLVVADFFWREGSYVYLEDYALAV